MDRLVWLSLDYSLGVSSDLRALYDFKTREISRPLELIRALILLDALLTRSITCCSLIDVLMVSCSAASLLSINISAIFLNL